MAYDETLLKTWLRVDIDEDNAILQMLYQNAEQYICSAVSKDVTPEKLDKYSQFQQAAILLAGHWYNSKFAVAQTTALKVNNDEIPFGVTALIWQVRGQYYNDNQSNE